MLLPRDHDLLPEHDNEVVLNAIRQLPNLRYVWLHPRYHSYDAWREAQDPSTRQTKGLDRFISDLKQCGNTSNRGIRGLYFRCPPERTKYSFIVVRTTEADEWKEIQPKEYFEALFYEKDHVGQFAEEQRPSNVRLP